MSVQAFYDDLMADIAHHIDAAVVWGLIYGEWPDLESEEFRAWAAGLDERTAVFMARLPAGLRADLEALLRP